MAMKDNIKFALYLPLLIVAYLVLWILQLAKQSEGKIFRLVEILLMFMLIYVALFFACSI